VTTVPVTENSIAQRVIPNGSTPIMARASMASCRSPAQGAAGVDGLARWSGARGGRRCHPFLRATIRCFSGWRGRAARGGAGLRLLSHLSGALGRRQHRGLLRPLRERGARHHGGPCSRSARTPRADDLPEWHGVPRVPGPRTRGDHPGPSDPRAALHGSWRNGSRDPRRLFFTGSALDFRRNGALQCAGPG